MSQDNSDEGWHSDSEFEDMPRRILDTVNGDFTVPANGLSADGNTHEKLVFKLGDFRALDKDENGEKIPFGGYMSIRPVPNPISVERAKTAMGNGDNKVWVGTSFIGPSDGEGEDKDALDGPEALFAHRKINSTFPGVLNDQFMLRRRHVPHIGPLKTMLVFTDGACVDESYSDARGGWAFVWNRENKGTIWGALEKKGPDGLVYPATKSRADLRAAAAALEYIAWWGRGWERVVIATDSDYVVDGATAWIKTWAARDWRTSGGTRVQNRDLWEQLSKKMGYAANAGCEISFWRIPRKWNEVADRAARHAAVNGRRTTTYGYKLDRML